VNGELLCTQEQTPSVSHSEMAEPFNCADGISARAGGAARAFCRYALERSVMLAITWLYYRQVNGGRSRPCAHDQRTRPKGAG
jgi:hypothetical protein